ncbi:hypothetical protein D7X33_22160, partial [Butyricicoccus sp. 1XD8-22]
APRRRGVLAPDSGRALPCTRDFFEKKSSKNFYPAAAGNGFPDRPFCLLPRPPKGRRAGWFSRNAVLSIIICLSHIFFLENGFCSFAEAVFAYFPVVSPAWRNPQKS